MCQCCYFLRNGKVDSSISNDASLYYQEMCEPLETLRQQMTTLYRPLFAASDEWGYATEQQKADFMEATDKWIQTLTSAVESLKDGLELRRVSDDDVRALGSSGQGEEDVTQVENLLEEWCEKIDEFKESFIINRSSKKPHLEGPREEIEYWRVRAQKLSSITEVMKRKDCRYVVSVLSSFAKMTDQPKSETIQLIKRWNQIEMETIETVNEAKDNLKYLSTLHRFIEPLYSGTVQSMIDTLPALMNSIKVPPIQLVV